MISYNRDTLPHELRCPHTQATMRPVMCNRCTAEDLDRVYTELKRAYYAGEKPYLSDGAFDRFEQMCRTRWPEDSRFRRVGS